MVSLIVGSMGGCVDGCTDADKAAWFSNSKLFKAFQSFLKAFSKLRKCLYITRFSKTFQRFEK